ncbi:MAG: DUF924 domain-containing protein [Bdellovibrionaceae bacterium]|nr:DUF924 domain-containing protein [Pseudobdellovibrionaceae bacterium]
MNAQSIFQYWFKELAPEQWFVKSRWLDDQMRDRFGEIHEAAARGELTHWRDTMQNRLAEVLLLDQFSRNIHRDTAKAFAQDALALDLAKAAIATGQDRDLPVEQRTFLYMPFMHSEDPAEHVRAVELFSGPGFETQLNFELKHKAIIDRFGRYPHRNVFLGRDTTPEELEFLKGPDSSF